MMTARKKSKDESSSIYSLHNTNDMLTAEENTRFNTERKKSGSSSNNSKGKDRDKSEGSLPFQTEGRNNDKVTPFYFFCIIVHNILTYFYSRV